MSLTRQGPGVTLVPTMNPATQTVPPAFTTFVAAGARYRGALCAFERAATPENEQTLRAAERALCRAAETLPELNAAAYEGT